MNHQRCSSKILTLTTISQFGTILASYLQYWVSSHIKFKFIMKKIYMLEYYTYNMESKLKHLIYQDNEHDNQLIIYDIIT